MYNLENLNTDQIDRLCDLTQPVRHELTVECVIQGTSPGEIFADNETAPRSCFIKTPECNVLAGDTTNKAFLEEIRQHIGYYDIVVCADGKWESIIETIHPNIGLRRYPRFKYQRTDASFLPVAPQGDDPVRLLYASDLETITFGNPEIVRDWINILNVEKRPGVCLAAVVLDGNDMVACSALDCLIDDRAEIGIRTFPAYRKKGLGYLAASSLINALHEAGIRDIGWHCVATNLGSRRIAEKCGFQKVLEYSFFCPFVPIENNSDLTAAEWNELALFFSKKGSISPSQHWQAARCSAKTGDWQEARESIRRLGPEGIDKIKPYLISNPEFAPFLEIPEWRDFLLEIGI